MYWIYWENKHNIIPPIVKILIEIFKKRLHNKLIILNNFNIKNYIDIVNTNHIKHIAQKTDYYRAKILYTHGGIWLDIDTILLKDLDILWNKFNKSNKECCMSKVHIFNNKNNICLAYLMSKKNSTIFKYWYLAIEEIINKKINISYCYFGNLLAEIIIRNKLENTIYPFDSKIFRFGCNNSNKYYNQDPIENKKTMDKIRKEDYDFIVLYGSTNLYTKFIPKNSILNQFLKYSFEK